MSAEHAGRRGAEAFRTKHRLGSQPLGDLVTLVEQTTGHDVAVLDAPADEHGLTMRDPERGVIFIAVARTRNPMRQRSSLAHELAHVVFNDWDGGQGSSRRSSVESRADAFARHLLIPRAGLQEFIEATSVPSERDLSEVVQRFLVSPQIAAIALHDCGHIDTSTKYEWMNLTTRTLATRFGWSDLYGSLQDDSDRIRAPQQLLARAISGYREGVVSPQMIANLRSVPVATVLEDFTEAGIEPPDNPTPWIPAVDLPPVAVDLSELEDDPFEGRTG